jgi:glycosyltransferase involved in cell wall biosynthesis
MRAEGDTGVQTHFRSFADYLAKQGNPSRLVTPFDAPKWLVFPVFAVRRLIDLLNGAASVWWYRHWHAVFLHLALRRVLADGFPCVIYAQCPLSADAAIRAKISASQRVVMVVHFNISQADEWMWKGKIVEGGLLFKAIHHFEADVLPKLDGLVFVSDFVRRVIAKRIPAIEKVPSRVIPNFLRDPGLVVQDAKPLGDLICVGTLEPRKNQRYAIEIVAAAKQMGRQLKLTLVGDGKDRTGLESLARNLGVSDLISFAGFVKQGAELMRQHHAYLHVARMESFGIVLVEAMSRGLPVFAPAVGGIPEVFDDGIEGRVIPLDAADVAAKLIVEWLDSDDLMKQASMAARNRYLNAFRETQVAANLADFLNTI